MADPGSDQFALANKDLDDELKKIEAENNRGRVPEEDEPMPVRSNAGQGAGAGSGVAAGNKKKKRDPWVPDEHWHVVGQNPPDFEKPPNPVWDSLRKVRKDYTEALRNIDSPGYSARLAQQNQRQVYESPKKPKPVYQSGPMSPSMHPRGPPEWAARLEGEELFSSPDADRQRPREGGLYYPSSPLVTGRTHRVDPYAHHREQPSDEEALRFIQQERQRVQQAAYDFYRANGRVPNLPTMNPTSPVESSVQQVLAGTYTSPKPASELFSTPQNRNTPSKSAHSPSTHHVLTPSVHLQYSPQADPKPSDIFYPR
eukprot:TRINITY_DN25350_c0_g1_i1.p1 TRINITY_DN25350_c0_g1~~TRINITY_DN25350_c0_g1_i1.p1  ORF type:complete len:330 (+),score=114.62 TRINITY_DN25350_c0_g1_i1:53-991(+)